MNAEILTSASLPFVVMYLNLIQIAESFGVSEKVVEGWIRDEGLPSHAGPRPTFV